MKSVALSNAIIVLMQVFDKTELRSVLHTSDDSYPNGHYTKVINTIIQITETPNLMKWLYMCISLIEQT